MGSRSKAARHLTRLEDAAASISYTTAESIHTFVDSVWYDHVLCFLSCSHCACEVRFRDDGPSASSSLSILELPYVVPKTIASLRHYLKLVDGSVDERSAFLQRSVFSCQGQLVVEDLGVS